MTKPVYILDSGAFSAKYSGVDITLDEYIDFCKQHTTKFKGGALTLDVIGDYKKSYENWRRMLDAGIRAIPVLHLQGDRGEETTWEHWLERYLDETDYIAIGAIAKLNSSARFRGLGNIWNKIPGVKVDHSGTTPVWRRTPELKHKVHGLGLTSLRIMQRYPWYSVDSASCIKNGMNGAIYIPGDEGGKLCNYDTDKVRSIAVSDQRKHETGKTTSFYGYYEDSDMRRIIKEYIRELGFDIADSIEGRVLRSRRHRLGEVRTNKYDLGFGSSEEVIDEKEVEKTLTNSYEMREKYNLAFFNRLNKHIEEQVENRIKIYHVCSQVKHVQSVCEQSQTDQVVARMLLSYHILNTKRALREYVLS